MVMLRAVLSNMPRKKIRGTYIFFRTLLLIFALKTHPLSCSQSCYHVIMYVAQNNFILAKILSEENTARLNQLWTEITLFRASNFHLVCQCLRKCCKECSHLIWFIQNKYTKTLPLPNLLSCNRTQLQAIILLKLPQDNPGFIHYFLKYNSFVGPNRFLLLSCLVKQINPTVYLYLH